jgi:hypothetical protein
MAAADCAGVDSGRRRAPHRCMPDKQKDAKHGEKQTDLAEGERSTVDESIRAHEKKHDQQGQPAPKK